MPCLSIISLHVPGRTIARPPVTLQCPGIGVDRRRSDRGAIAAVNRRPFPISSGWITPWLLHLFPCRIARFWHAPAVGKCQGGGSAVALSISIPVPSVRRRPRAALRGGTQDEPCDHLILSQPWPNRCPPALVNAIPRFALRSYHTDLLCDLGPGSARIIGASAFYGQLLEQARCFFAAHRIAGSGKAGCRCHDRSGRHLRSSCSPPAQAGRAPGRDAPYRPTGAPAPPVRSSKDLASCSCAMPIAVRYQYSASLPSTCSPASARSPRRRAISGCHQPRSTVSASTRAAAAELIDAAFRRADKCET